MIKFNFLPKFALVIVVTFVIFTIIGTQLHELGHISVAKFYGYETELYHDSMVYYPPGYLEDEDFLKLQKINIKYKDYDYEHLPQKVKNEIKTLLESLEAKFPSNKNDNGLFVTIGGPAQTVFTSFIGLSILLFRRKKGYGFKAIDWLGVFLTLFILREVFNFCHAILKLIITNPEYYIGDEFRISRDLSLNQWSIPLIMFVIGTLISVYVIFKIIPLKYRFTFIISGFIGGLLGYAIWFGFWVNGFLVSSCSKL